MGRKRNLIKTTFIILIGKICTQMISFFLLPLYTSYLISEDYGFVDLITTYVSLLVPLLSLQLEMAIFRYLIDARGNTNKQSKLISTNMICIFACVFLAIVLLMTVNMIFQIKYIYYIIAIIAVNIISGNFMQISRGLGDNLSYSISSVISGAMTVIFNVLFIVVLNFGAKGMLIAMLIANFLCATYLLFKLKLYQYIHFSYFDKKICKKLFKYAIPLVPNGIAWWIMNALDRTIISILLNVSANGIYAVSNKFPSLVTSFFGIFNLAWSESASVSIHDDDKDSYFSSVCNDVLRIFSTFITLIIAVIPFVFPFLIKGEYVESYQYIPILLISSLFSLIASQYGSIYIAQKETKKIAITTFVSAIINVVSHLLLINFIGLYAAAISTAISYLIIMIYRHIDIQKYVKVTYSPKIVVVIMVMLTFSVCCYYQNKLLLNLISLIGCTIFALVLNVEYLKKIKAIFKNLLLKKIQ